MPVHHANPGEPLETDVADERLAPILYPRVCFDGAVFPSGKTDLQVRLMPRSGKQPMRYKRLGEACRAWHEATCALYSRDKLLYLRG